MNEIEKILKKYDFFKEKEFEIFMIQDYGRKSKFKIKMGEKYYTLILEKERIKPYINKFAVLGDNFKKIIGFQYLSQDKKVLVLDYFGNDKGIDLIKADSNLIVGDYVLQLKIFLNLFIQINKTILILVIIILNLGKNIIYQKSVTKY